MGLASNALTGTLPETWAASGNSSLICRQQDHSVLNQHALTEPAGLGQEGEWVQPAAWDSDQHAVVLMHVL